MAEITPIEYVKGIGPRRAERLKKELGFFTVLDLFEYYPFRYEDRSRFYKISELTAESEKVQLIGEIRNLNVTGHGRQKRMTAVFRDETSAISLVWFKGIDYFKKNITPGVKYVLFGKPSNFKGTLNFVHPELEPLTEAKLKKGAQFQPVYNSSEYLTKLGLNSKGFEKAIRNAFIEKHHEISETLPEYFRKKYQLINRKQALKNIHFPESLDQLQKARFRLKFEEFFFIQLQILNSKHFKKEASEGFVFSKVGEHFNNFYKNKLPFELTGAQKRVVKEIRKDTASSKQMNRLLQGDVGSGKTMVALLCMLIALDNDFQCALIAPTEILATQHYETLAEQLEGTGIKIDLLTGSVKAAKRRVLHPALESGEIHILIGTHALLEDKVKFKNLGFVVIDEQHRFGVAQRSKMWKKNTRPPHVLVMSATPIPRTLAMTLYGDLDVSVIDELPPGRKPIETIHKYDRDRLGVQGFMKREIAKGRQVYVVYPLIEESENMDYKDLMDGYESITRDFPPPKYRTSIVHGKMKPEHKEYEMQQFASGKTHIMVATTVIEVGVNVPNASVMIIESAERFGLSQLHQLRGRVGRGAEQSYCILITGFKLSADGRTRMETMVRTNDGFEIAEVDLNLRGPGDLLGTQQSGLLDLKIADLAKDNKILQYARNAASELLKADPKLEHELNKPLKRAFLQFQKDRPDWGRIS